MSHDTPAPLYSGNHRETSQLTSQAALSTGKHFMDPWYEKVDGNDNSKDSRREREKERAEREREREIEREKERQRTKE